MTNIIKTRLSNCTISDLKDGDIFSISDPRVNESDNIYLKSTISMIDQKSEESPVKVPIFVDLTTGNLINISNDFKIHKYSNVKIIVE